MIVFPAIDLRQGQVVRLRQGDPQAETVFGTDPVQVARRWVGQGAQWLHVVNLDGALGEQGGAALNLRRLAEIRAATGMPIQFGGGVRSTADVGRALDLGASRVLLGTVAVRAPEVVGDALARYGAERVMVALDARHGLVATHGWQSTSTRRVEELALQMRELGLRRAIFTDVARDGMLTGVNVTATAALARASGLLVIASGGVAGLSDIEALRRHEADGVEGVIVGQALYTGAIDLPGALAAARGATASDALKEDSC
jgi:phosphoribosylformimino-5-aminoimidazole carboxamide ribotide isomerase